MKHFRLALGFLTAIPTPVDLLQPGDLGRAAIWFPVIGFGIGLMLGAAHFVLSRLLAPLLAAALIVALWAAITGGLHLDGLADCCDGVLASTTPARRLEIMRDPRLGAFGVAGLTLFLILKTSAVASLPQLSIAAFALAAVVSRWLILIVARQPSARPGGMGDEFARGLTLPVTALAALLPLALVVFVSLGTWRAWVAAGLAHFTALVIITFARTRLGGVTGDVLGLTVELSELAVLLTFAASP